MKIKEFRKSMSIVIALVETKVGEASTIRKEWERVSEG